MGFNGINTPLLALKTEKSCGNGEFLDLLALVDWCEELQFSIIQLLPLNDSGFDPSPYNACSAFALHPIYISLHALPHVTDLSAFHAFNQLPKVDYQAVLTKKLAFLKHYYTTVFDPTEPEYLAFLSDHHWVHAYITFKKDPMYGMIQYFAFKQLRFVKAYANGKGIRLKGDIPILISPDSLDVQLYPSNFQLSLRAGAPPDMFSQEGQYWGFPIYHWDAVEKEHFAWWKNRLAIASLFYDLFRIDHIIGFYRIWAIPEGQPAKNGHFIPEGEEAAIRQGEHLLKTLLSSTKMVPIGEDLGWFIDHIRASLARLAIPGTKIPRWERYYGGDNSFIPYDKYPTCSLTTLSTHDTELLDEWWHLFPEDASEFARCFHLPKALTPDARALLLHQHHHAPSDYRINLLQEYLALEPTFVSKDARADRINIPNTVLKSNWCHRYKPFLSDIMEHKDLTNTIASFTS